MLTAYTQRMATLTEAAHFSRNAIKWGGVGLVALIILRLLLGSFFDFLRQVFPAKTLVPNNYYGKLGKIEFPKSASPSGQLTYTLQTISGTVPVASEAARVYFMPKNRSNLLSLSRTQNLVSLVGFTSSPQQLTETSYRWLSPTNPLRTITVDTVSHHFTLSYDYLNDLRVFNDGPLPSAQQALIESSSFIQILNTGIEDLDYTRPKIQYLKLVGDQLIPTPTQSQANAIRVDFYRKSYNGLPVVSEKVNEGTITFIISPSRNIDKKFLLVRYNYWPLDATSPGIYALKKSETAFAELQQGSAYFANFDKTKTAVTITNVYLAYYDSTQPQLYLQPVFVFVGENDFVAYVPAIAPPYGE